MTPAAVDVVIPSIGRPTLVTLLDRLGDCAADLPGAIIIVDDRRHRSAPILDGAKLPARARIVVSGGRGPAAARNRGWRTATAPWVVFLDDDVVPADEWFERLLDDLDQPPDVGGSQARIVVPHPANRRPTDWERNVRGLETARWATADMAYRRPALNAVEGFDESFPRAYREDADLALRVLAAGYRLVRGSRATLHRVRPADAWISVRTQRGNQDDVLMRALHGPGWQRKAGIAPGRRSRHVAITLAAAAAIAARLSGRPRLSTAAALAWLLGTAELAWTRIATGPRVPREVTTMLVTSIAIPPAATAHTVIGLIRLPWLLRQRARRSTRRPDAVLLDRDGTLVVDVPYNGDATRVQAIPGVRAALDRLRAAGVRLAVISNQSGVGRGLLTIGQVQEVNARVEALLGPFSLWLICTHAPSECCACRKPAPGMLLDALLKLRVAPDRCVMIGDIGADIEAARAAGVRGILVPNAATRVAEVTHAPETAGSLNEAVDRLLQAGA